MASKGQKFRAMFQKRKMQYNIIGYVFIYLGFWNLNIKRKEVDLKRPAFFLCFWRNRYNTWTMNLNICRPVEAFETDIINVRINEIGQADEKVIFLYGLNPIVTGIIKLSKFKRLLPDYDPDSLLGCRCSFSGYLNAGPSINIEEIRM